MRSLEWMGSALCAQSDPAVFFPEAPGTTLGPAKNVCEACPVRIECGEHAQFLEGDLSRSRRYGAWGGKSPVQRAEDGGTDRTAERDAAIIRLTGRGMTPTEIAAQLGISQRTVARVKAAHKAGATA